jgi:hypothetical protein
VDVVTVTGRHWNIRRVYNQRHAPTSFALVN